MNSSNIGQAVFQVCETSKPKRTTKKPDGVSNEKCEYCHKKTTPSNKARHLRACPVKNYGKGANCTIYSAHRKKPTITTYIEELVIDDNKQKIYPIVDKLLVLKDGKEIIERAIIYIVGASGSGKSRWASNYCEKYKEKYSYRPQYLFSRLEKDEALDKLKYIKRVKLDKMLESDIELEDLKDSLCIFDDIEAIENKAILAKINNLMHRILTMGRHTNTSIIFCKHIACDQKKHKIY